MRLRIVPLLILVITPWISSGCFDIKSMGGASIPQYSIPDAPVFTAEEQAVLIQFSKDHPALFKRIQNQALAYKAILISHNAWAKETNRKRLEALGFKEEDVRGAFDKGK